MKPLARPPDDRRHSVLSRARPLAQVSMAAFLEGAATLPASDFGTYEVREVDAKSALTKCAMPGEPWSLNPYTGCSHACAYCYVPDVAHVERPRWGAYVLVKRNLARVLSREVRRKPRRDVFLSSATDPYQPAEATHGITRQCLGVLRRVDWPLRVLTRSPLVRRDIRLLSEFSDLTVGLSVPTLDDEVRRLVEPAAPPIEGRLRALRALADAGFEPFANYAPAYPLTGGITATDVARAFEEAGVATVHAFPWRYLPSVGPLLTRTLRGTPYEALASEVADPGASSRLLADLRAAFARTRVRFNPPFPPPAPSRPARAALS